MEIQGRVISIQHNSTLARDNVLLKARIKEFEWLIENQKQEIAAQKQTVAKMRRTMLVKDAEVRKDKEKRKNRGKLQTRRGWVEPK